MTTREEIIDRIRKELERQQQKRAVALRRTNTPDVVEIHGHLDLLALASTVLDP